MIPAGLDLRLLPGFVVLAEELHFGRAAARLHIAQPGLSQQIRRLERQLGSPLFERDKRHVELTAAGHALLAHADRALRLVNAGAHAARRAACGSEDRLVIGLAHSARVTMGPWVESEALAAGVAAPISWREGETDELAAALERGELDASVCFCAERSPDLELVKICDEEVVALVHPTDALAGSQEVHGTQLIEHRLAVPADCGASFRAAAGRVWRAWNDHDPVIEHSLATLTPVLLEPGQVAALVAADVPPHARPQQLIRVTPRRQFAFGLQVRCDDQRPAIEALRRAVGTITASRARDLEVAA